MTTSWRLRPATQGCMGAWRALLLVHSFWSLVGWWVLGSAAVLSHVEGQSVVFTQAPAAHTSNTSAFFGFAVVDANGSDPCGAAGRCSIQCKLDLGNFQDCLGRTHFYVNLPDGSHSFTVSVNTSSGTHFTNMFTWSVDTVPPTATVDAGGLYTNAVNMTVFIYFTEVCSGLGGFQCQNASFCDLLVYGNGTVLPSTLEVLKPGLVYSIQVSLSTLVPSGKVTIATRRQLCTDAAGNPFQRSPNSSVVVHFDRTQPSVNLWTAIRNSQVVIRDRAQTVQATNDSADLKIYLDFDEPILGTATELQSLLNVTSGIPVATHRKSRGNRRFGFLLTLNDTRVAVVTITLPGNTTVTRYGTPVAKSTSVSFLYDIKRPQVQLSTTARAHTQDRLLPIVIQFTKPVFSFDASGVTLSGGMLRSFKEISKTTYALMVSTMESNTFKVSVAENRTLDVAGNPNMASSVLQVRHYTTPTVSVAIYSIITAGLLGTALASAALAVSSANLAAVATLSSQAVGPVGADPSRNLLGMAGHMQILALSEFLAVSLPVEYAETAKGLRWLIPHVNTPWQKNDDTNMTNFGTNVQADPAVMIRRRALLMVAQVPARDSELEDGSSRFPQRFISRQHRQNSGVKCTAHGTHSLSNYSSCAYVNEPSILKSFDDDEDFLNTGPERRRRLGADGTEFGPSLSAGDYETYFLNQAANLRLLQDELNASKYTGWSDFERNMFWLAVVGGGLILLHILTLLFLRWRMKTMMLHGALSFPRFELFLLILALPAMCQASAFVIRGGTTAGIVVGVLLLLVPASFLFSVALFLILTIFVRRGVQYKELRPQRRRDGTAPPPPTRKPLSLVAGAGYHGKWVRRDGLDPALIPRYGILFEDRKGPPRLVTMIDNSNLRKGIGRDGLRRIAIMTSDDESDEAPVARPYELLGCFQSAYILLELSRRVALGVIFGAYPRSDRSWAQVSLVFVLTVVQFLYLVAAKPFQRRGVQLVETVSLLCEVGIFAAALALLAQGRPADDHFGVGVFMLVLLVLSFAAQFAHEWFALTRQLLQLSKTDETPARSGLKELGVGLILPLLPRRWWPRFMAPPGVPPPGMPSSVLQANVGLERRPSSTSGRRGSPLELPTGEPGNIPAYDPASPRFRDPMAAAAAARAGTKPGRVPPSVDYWPGEDLQQWRRQNSLERKRLENELNLSTAPTDEIYGADPVAKSSTAAASSSVARPQRRTPPTSQLGSSSNRIHSSDSLPEVPSDGDFTPDRPQPGEFGPAPVSSRTFDVRLT